MHSRPARVTIMTPNTHSAAKPAAHASHAATATHAPRHDAPAGPAHPAAPPARTFKDFALSAGTLDAIAAMGYEEPSPIQRDAIPHLLQGRDLLGQARTGTGKTAAFGIPLIEKVRPVRNGGVVALILVPTRELALQVSQELSEIAKASGIRVIPVYGGAGFGKQNDMLHQGGTHIVVATPGRLLDHLQQGTVRLDKVQTLILDEADRMLDMGFLPDMQRVLRAVPKVRQTALFSATVPDQIRKLTSQFLNDPVNVKVETGPTATPLCDQFKAFVEKPMKTRSLLALLAKEKPERTIVFTRTKHLAKRLAPQLGRSGHKAIALQGNMSQGQRERAMEAFRAGDVDILVATDVASRGIDVPEVSHVVNFDLPDEPEAYVHRIGRTGRMGRTGRAFTFVQSDEHRDLKLIERISGIPMADYEIGDLPPEPAAAPQSSDQGPRSGSNSRHGRPAGPGHHAKKSPQGGFGRSGGRSGGGGGGGRGPPRSGGGGGGGRSSSGGRSNFGGGRSSSGRSSWGDRSSSGSSSGGGDRRSY
ncbi:MAG TPA: DEAD/DEAH box helicase [Candidatus Thermoplasmatota archaeon]|nr:DEAD/DEAH box helicase [Candidatus Thermoplasmatota archaeon]